MRNENTLLNSITTFFLYFHESKYCNKNEDTKNCWQSINMISFLLSFCQTKCNYYIYCILANKYVTQKILLLIFDMTIDLWENKAIILRNCCTVGIPALIILQKLLRWKCVSIAICYYHTHHNLRYSFTKHCVLYNFDHPKLSYFM